MKRYGMGLGLSPSARDRSFPALKKALELGPKDKKDVCDIEYWLGGAYRALRMNAEAVEMGRMLVRDSQGLENEKTRKLDGEMLIGYGYQCMGEYEKAIPFLKDVVENLDPKHPGALHNLGTCYHRVGNYQEALAMFERIPDSRAKIEQATIILTNQNKPDEAIAMYRRAIASGPVNPDDSYGFLQACRTVKGGDSVVDAIRTIVVDSPNEVKAKAMANAVQAVCRAMQSGQAKQEDVAAALKLLTDGTSGIDGDIVKECAYAWYTRGKWSEAKQVFQVLWRQGYSYDLQTAGGYMVADCRRKLGDEAGAVELFQEIIKNYPATPVAEAAQRRIQSGR